MERANLPQDSSPDSPPTRWLRVLLCVAVVVGIALRTLLVSEIPPGLYRDEAYTGMDGLATLREGPRLFYTSAFGREPLFTWLVAGSTAIWGATPFAVRFPSVVTGCLTLFALYLASRELWDERVAVLATAVLSVTLWHVVFSRLGFRAVLVPLIAALSVWATARGIKTSNRLWWAAGGALAGLLLYTYIAARVAVVPAFIMIGYTWWRNQSLRQPALGMLLVFVLAALVVMLPLLIYMGVHVSEVADRTGSVASVFNSETPWAMLWANVKGVLGMFFVRGDYLPRHNLPFRPVFDPALGAMFAIGLVVALVRAPTDYAMAFLLAWLGSMLLPTVLAEKAPHFVRGIGILPFLAILPALGLDWLWGMLERRGFRRAHLAVVALLTAGLASTVWGVFVAYPQVTDLCYRFECAGTHLASEVNRYLEQGWTEGAWFAEPGPARTDRQVFVQYQLWKDVVNAHYLIPDSSGFNVPGDGTIVSVPPNPDLPMVYYGWSNRDYPDYWAEDMRAWLPSDARIELTEGPLIVTEQQKEPHPAYLEFRAEPAEVPANRLATLDYDLSLVSSCVEPSDAGVQIRLVWYADQPSPANFTVFLHYERNAQIIAQSDGEPGLGYYPMMDWRPGDQFVDVRGLDVTEVQPEDRAYAGLYYYPTGERVSVRSAGTQVSDDRIVLNLGVCDR